MTHIFSDGSANEERFLAEIAAQLTIAWAAKTPSNTAGRKSDDTSRILEVFNQFRKILRESPQ